MRHSFLTYLAIVACTSTLLLAAFYTSARNPALHLYPQHEETGGESTSTSSEDLEVHEADSDGESLGWMRLYALREANLTRTLVIASIAEESTDWVQQELADIIVPNGPLDIARYVSDNSQALLHPPQNKGHEANMYLSYIIDHYEALADVVIFIHSHQKTWHNNDLLDLDSALGVRNLSPAHSKHEKDDYKKEESILADAWLEIFPGDDVPRTLAQPCCGQFAVSGERIRSIPRSRYEELRSWIYNSDLGDDITGGVFEYIWQYIFLEKSTIACPSPQACHCDLYGVCFRKEDGFEEWETVHKEVVHVQEQLGDWDAKGKYHEEHCLPEAVKELPDNHIFPEHEELHRSLQKKLHELEDKQKMLARDAYEHGREVRGL